jgi:hypothetical protein
MGKVHDRIDDRMRSWLCAQPVFFVATAPLAADGHINLSPRGLAGTFAVLDDHRVAWLDMNGSGAETAAHLRENGRIVVMFCSFSGAPDVVRLHGRGHVVRPDDAEWGDLVERFPGCPPARAAIVVDVDRISNSCGFGVPLMDHVGDRDLMRRWAAKRSPEQIAEYQRTRNATSIDGLPALPGAAAVPSPSRPLDETVVSTSETTPAGS